MTISNCGHDENNAYSGGTAGDQSGTEYYLRSWYSGFTRVYRHSDASIRAAIADVATKAAQNDKIGYDQNERLTYYNQLKANSWKPENITTACEADCSSSTAAAVIAAGNRCGNSACASVSPSMTTYNEDAQLLNAGFERLTASKYTSSDSYLLAGDILWKSSHTAIVVTDGSNASSETASSASSSTSATSVSYSVKVTVSDLNIRSGAGLSYGVVGTATKNKTYSITKEASADGYTWGYSSALGGWIALTYTSRVSTSGTSSSGSYGTGTYVTIVDCLNVRTGAGTNYSKKSKSQLTSDGQKHSNSSGQLDSGTTVTVSAVSKDGSGNPWGQIPSGWICLEYNGTAYVRKKG